MTSGVNAKGRFGKQDFVYVAADDGYLCPAGEQLTYHYTNEEDDKTLRRYWTTACQGCALKIVMLQYRILASASLTWTRSNLRAAIHLLLTSRFGLFSFRMQSTMFAIAAIRLRGDLNWHCQPKNGTGSKAASVGGLVHFECRLFCAGARSCRTEMSALGSLSGAKPDMTRTA
jgi:hypothetical protein